LKGDIRSSACYGINSRRNKRKMPAGNVKGCYIVDWTGAFNKGVFLVAPTDTLNAGEFSIYTRIIGGIPVVSLVDN
jgi:hypothetical protein